MHYLSNGWAWAALAASAFVLLERVGVVSGDLSAHLALLASWEDRFSLGLALLSLLSFAVGSTVRKKGFRTDPGGAGLADPDTRTATSALLVELAYADGDFSSIERAYVEETLEDQFALAPRAATLAVRRAE